jgi:hypothetical protein
MDHTQKVLEQAFVGREAKADHPITCLNPEATFIIKQVRLEDGGIAVRGERTMWFGDSCFQLVV